MQRVIHFSFPFKVKEHIQIHSNVSISDLKKYILEGKVMLPSVQTSIMALEWLRANGYLNASNLSENKSILL